MASNTNPSSSSSSSSQIIVKYDVFISFRGVDTRNNFTDHLFAALRRKSIHAFRDDKKLKKGEAIAPELIQAIEGSHVYIVVFSKNYASSTWCLRELAKIVECHNVSGKRVLPVFYEVDPSDVRKQSGEFGKAFAGYEEIFKENLEMIQRWREALIQVANLCGWDIRDKPENEEIEKIIKEFLPNLRDMDLSHSEHLIKMPNFSEVPNLERLNLEGCIRLAQINPSIGRLTKLVLLNLKNCKALVSIPENVVSLSSLETLNFSGCSNLQQLVVVKPRHVNHLNINDTSETTIHRQSTSSMKKMPCVRSLWPFLPKFPHLLDVDLSFCNLLRIPDSIGSLHCLERLNLGGNRFVSLPACTFKELLALRYLNLEHCKQLKYLPELPSRTVLPTSRRTTFTRLLGLIIYDCPNLCDVKRCYSIALSWMIRIIEMEMGQIYIAIPGNRIPRWCDKQNVGWKIMMDPSPSVQDNNWIGVACCATFVAHDAPPRFTSSPFIVITFVKEPGPLWDLPAFFIPINLDKDVVTVELDHLVLCFITREQLIDHIRYITQAPHVHDLDGLEMIVQHHHSQGLDLEVKNCGYRWLFEGDLEQLKATMTQGESSSIRKRKLLTM
ncbi:hypothetical protein RIF29_31250 [Crotalaria pallida]|uniref:TIR domain-containing protein n=1 Tax=Crotalaria pallida TaxID=3830 RepID=A0AAN9EP21_CROPI